MAKIVVSEFLTLDGVMQGPGGPDEDRSDGFDQGGWTNRVDDIDDDGNVVLDSFEHTDALLLGRKTYDNFASFWPNVPADDPFGTYMNGFRKYVVSTTLGEPLSWENSTLISPDIPKAVNELRAAPGKDIQVIGSGVLVQTLIAHDLVDAYRLMVYPITLGTGKRLFRDGTAGTRLKLTDSYSTKAGILILTYVPAPA
ncbi:MAG: dihydrofolate reductase family protein [Candidatus Limnocylindrales bacterium]